MGRLLLWVATAALVAAWTAPGEARTGGAVAPAVAPSKVGGGTPYPQRRRAKQVSLRDHRFPLGGPFEYGGADARFGVGRGVHVHQGQDLIASEGTPVLAPRGGLVKAVGYQARRAGHYVVVDGAGEQRDYVFMHLRTGSIPVHEGEVVATGQQIGEVGTTGRASAPHLHFEVWTGRGWFTGGEPVDPLPLLRTWARAT